MLWHAMPPELNTARLMAGAGPAPMLAAAAAEVVAAARDEGAGASPGQQPGGGVPAQAMDTGAGARPAASPLAAPVDPSTPAPSTTTTL